MAGSSHVTRGRNGTMSLSHVGTDSQKTRQGGLNHFTTVGGQGCAGSDKPQEGGQIPARSRGKGQGDQKQGLGEASEQRRLHPITLISPSRSVRSILGPLKDRSSCSRFWA